MDMFSFYLDNILRPVFEDLKFSHNDPEDSELEDDHLEADRAVEGAISEPAEQDNRSMAISEPASKSSKRVKSTKKHKRGGPEDILDLQGPKLIEGYRVWILFYQIVGQLNWLGAPFYLSIIYKILLMGIISYVFYHHFILEFLELSIIDLTYRNPIFIFISFLAITSTAFNTALAFYTNLFNLCPLFKVLTTQRLCFITEDVQHILGTKTTSCIFIFYAYHSSLMLLLVHTDLNEFVNNFNLGRFVIFLFCSICVIYHLIGLSHLDFYIRACFASWLIALKGNLEYRFAHLHKHQRLHRLRQSQRATRSLQMATGADSISSHEASTATATTTTTAAEAATTTTTTSPKLTRKTSDLFNGTTATGGEIIIEQQQQQHQIRQMTLERFREKYKIVTLDEIQKSLNTMDDHLEVWRSIQTSSLVLITLNAFLTNGALLLLAYNLLANRGNYYHGLLLILLVTNYTIVIFFCYIGDSWLYYALSSFVQTVEDEYFLQGGDNGSGLTDLFGRNSGGRSMAPLYGGELADLTREHQLLLIKKKDVLFCREFLHQFENHLATPWSKLTVKVHLRMVGTFVTLIAAQIIFDHEH